MVTALRVTSAALFFIGAHLIFFRVTNAAARFDNPISQNYSGESKSATSLNLITFDFDSKQSKRNQSRLDIYSGYQPPNYGSPDSEHGSGTR
jgi:hypothetical protein